MEACDYQAALSRQPVSILVKGSYKVFAFNWHQFIRKINDSVEGD